MDRCDGAQASVVGGGLLEVVLPGPCLELPLELCTDTGCSSDTGEDHVYALEGGGGCQIAPVGPGLSALMALVVLALRWIPALLLCVGLPARAADLQALQWLDAGPLPGISDPSRRAEWSSTASMGLSSATDPVVLRDGADRYAWIERLDTAELAATLEIRDWFRVGASMPVHAQRGVEPAQGPGDLSVFAVVPLACDARGCTAAEVAVEASAWETGDHTGATSAAVGALAERRLRHLIVAGRARVRLQEADELPGVLWGPRWELAAGATTPGPTRVGTMLLASAPLLPTSSGRGGLPAEALAFLATDTPWALSLTAGAGVGLTRGLGAPAFRGLGQVVWQPQPRDSDGDGLKDLRDLCPRAAEDADGFRDGDGCPDRDNDRDGLADALDACPNAAEVVNRYLDADGCPDALADLTVRVSSPEGLEEVWIGLDGAGQHQLEPRLRRVVEPGSHELVVRAPGHRSLRVPLALPEGPTHLELVLDPTGVAELAILLQDEAGAALTGTVELDSGAVVDAGQRVEVQSGRVRGRARSEGYLEQPFSVELRPGQRLAHTVVLEPVASLEPRPPAWFELDSAALDRGATDRIDELAAWLRAHPEIRLLRVEGRADAVGDPAYNYDLSVRRARSVIAALVGRGIDAKRLDAIGSGEARSTVEARAEGFAMEVAGVPLREVAFRVVVWDE